MRSLTVSLLFLTCVLPLQAQETVEQLLELGYTYYADGKYEKAIRIFDQAEALSPKNSEIYYLRGVCKSLIDQNEAAIGDYDKALSLKSDYPEVLFEKGYAYFLLDKPGHALQFFTEAIRLNPDYGEAYQNRGTVKCILGDKEGALEDWEKAETLGVQSPFQECS